MKGFSDMVRLQRLVLQGFKSFKRRTSIPLPPGFSVVTGPNGSGKSNLGDAISFVIGRSNARTMRAKKGDQLIFHGSKSKPASDYAAVTLFFDNSSKKLPLPDKEVSVGRKVNRNGVSTYRLNGRVATRQEVVDILSQAGIHPDGHNIIQQGDVLHIIEMDPEQRRGILDEISGIKEYDEKRHKALKELEAVDAKVREAEILLTEKGSVMAKLRAERDAALEHQKLTEELEKVKLSILIKDFTSTKEELDTVTASLAEKEKESKATEQTLLQTDKDLEHEEQTLQSLTKEVIQASSHLDLSRRIAQLQSGIEAKKERILSLDRELERLDSLVERVSRIENTLNPSLKEVLRLPGVRGVLSDLVVVPREYRTAVEVAAGGHLQDVVVDSMATAVQAVNFLKERRLGRARFLPLDKISGGPKPPLPPAAIGWLSSLIQYDRQYDTAMDYVFGRTACVKDIETAKEIMKRQRLRMVSLDGDLVEAAGAVTGGFYRKNAAAPVDVKGYVKDKEQLRKERESVEEEIIVLSKELNLLAEKERKTRVVDREKERAGLDTRLTELREARKKAYERRMILQQEIGKLNIQRAKLEARMDNVKVQSPAHPPEKPPYDLEVSKLRIMERTALERLHLLGMVNMKAIQDYDAVVNEFEGFKQKVDTIAAEKKAISDSLQAIENKRRATFEMTLTSVAKHFQLIYKDLTQGDAELMLENPADISTGLMIKATPPGKKLVLIDAMSGGEKTLTAFAFLFALQKHKPAPFYVLDEADAALDKVNTERIVGLLKKQSKEAQFIVISHNDGIVRQADQIFGVTMDDGESKVMGIELPPEDRLAASAQAAPSTVVKRELN